MTAIPYDNFVFDEPVKASSKLIYFLICSLLLHLIVVGYFYLNGWSDRIKHVPQREIAVQIEFNRNSQQRNSILETTEQVEPTPKPVGSETIVEQTQSEEVSRPTKAIEAKSSESQLIETTDVELTPTQLEPIQPEKVTQEANSQPQNKTQQPTTSMSFESIRQSIGKRETEEAILANEELQSGPYFDPTINHYLSEQEKEQSRLKALNAEKKRQEENEHFEFNTTGDTSVARINGSCFIVPQNTSMELDFRIWLPLGDCEKKKKLDFSTKKLDKEYQDGKRGY